MSDHVDNERLAELAPRMWRLLERLEYAEDDTWGWFCPTCEASDSHGTKGPSHKPDCEWLAIAKEIASRPAMVLPEGVTPKLLTPGEGGSL